MTAGSETLRAFEPLLDFLFPQTCAGCGEYQAGPAARRLCDRCLATIEPVSEPLCLVCGVPFAGRAGASHRCARCLSSPPAFRRARTLSVYRTGIPGQRGILESILLRHKYGRNQALGRALAELFDIAHPLEVSAYDVLIPVPMHVTRLRWRGFNQAALLAKALATRAGLPTKAGILRRLVATPPQTSNDLEERRLNVRGVFKADPRSLDGLSVLLVDDVITTGATAHECARALLQAGARVVDVIAVARAV